MADKTIKATILAPGHAMGTLTVIPRTATESPVEPLGSNGSTIESELQRFRNIALALAHELEQAADDLDADDQTKESGILRAHAAMAIDKGFHARVCGAIEEAELRAEQAVAQVAEDISGIFKKSDNPVFAARADDIHDIADQMRKRLTGERTSVLDRITEQAEHSHVIALEEVYPSLVLDAHKRGVQGIIVEYGTAFSHATILAEGFGMPILRIESLRALKGHDQALVVLKAEEHGILLIEPTEKEIDLAMQSQPVPKCSGEQDMRELPVRLWINITSPDEIPKDDWGCVRGIGLYRTEMALMYSHAQPPSEEEQFRTYQKLFEASGDRSVTVRCFDIGGDKPVEFMAFGHNDNPQLGLRSLRVFHYHPELFLTQARALLRAAGHRPLKLLFPMVETPEQWDKAQQLTDQALLQLHDVGLTVGQNLSRGFMIETPSCLWCLDDLLAAADFASIGTNDLVQYLLGVDRTSPDVAQFYQPEHPVVLRVLKRIASRARTTGTNVTLCGEMAHNSMLLPVLVGLGITDLSVPGRLAPRLADQSRHLDIGECRELAEQCVQSSRSREVRKLLADWHGEAYIERLRPRGAYTDPICGMVVDPETTPFLLIEGDQTLYFCSSACLVEYQKKKRRHG